MYICIYFQFFKDQDFLKRLDTKSCSKNILLISVRAIYELFTEDMLNEQLKIKFLLCDLQSSLFILCILKLLSTRFGEYWLGFPIIMLTIFYRSEFSRQAQTEDLELFGQRLREVSKTFVSEAGQGIILLFPFKFQSGHKS